ncbi:C4-dicarboxylate ABC transporter [Methylomicrobium sp. Wu6]|uniref:C4-dicarboxylate ABC transporter n=1 Tax=Methylomicrobium sp. Wu6 TaxID=3107928 RepID=UPI002DD63F93|nr:C4-dicarboxylate ABC transporter [Methylomicrobium sp. Wu6]MEC4748720.1 C4-dicarboxylate ABC transporter [Methylomicrobium sp. Wu6]
MAGWLILLGFSADSGALDNIALDVGALHAQGWKFEGIKIALSDLPERRQQLVLTIGKLSLPKPLDDLKLANIRCTSFTWGNNQVVCERGKARIDSKHWRSPGADFSFRLGEKSSRAKITNLRLFGGTVDAELSEQAMRWQVRLKAARLDGVLLQKQLGFLPAEIKNGEIDLALTISGEQSEIDEFDLNASTDSLTLQTADSKTATEALSSIGQLHAAHADGLWRWRFSGQLTGGALYQEPVYLEAGKEAIKLTGEGIWSPTGQRVDIESFTFDHAGTALMSGRATLALGAQVKLTEAVVSVQSDDLKPFSSVYLQPFAAQTALEGLSLQGRAKADAALTEQGLTSLTASFSDLAVQDESGRIKAEGGKGAIHWANDSAVSIPSTLGWQALSLYALPIGPAELSFASRAHQIELLKKTQLPFLGGKIAIKRFNYQGHPETEPDVYFEGSLNNVSLERLSSALHWTPLSGTLSGNIPGIEYRDKTLKLGGELVIKVFDGVVRIANLASSGLFSDLPKLSAEVEVDHLDLDQLTGKFQFGGITGKMSGFVKNLQLENWRPVSFYAWFGTPDDDDSRHRISQKAVQNIANIGGGGAADLLSRSFLQFFETFGYDKIGLGCYLHDGVCQLMGIEATSTGYSIIKGGGLPRIDVIGYNPRVDWSVLMERLERITTSDQVIIK